MNNKQTYWLRASFTILGFVCLGYLVKFYPETLTNIDSPIQSLVRGSLNPSATAFFKTITILGNTLTQIFITLIFLTIFYWKKWYIESAFLATSGLLAAVGIVTFKTIYERPRPSLTHLVEAGGFSFPSGHSMGMMMILGALLVIFSQRLQGLVQQVIKILLVLLIFLVGLSRIYLGVHYPTDVVAGFALGYGILNLFYPFYDWLRFKWRFQSKQL